MGVKDHSVNSGARQRGAMVAIRTGIARAGLAGLLFLLAPVLMAAKYDVVPPSGSHAGKDVLQPIEFPHNIHVKDNGINCMYCHTYARRSKVAGIPPTSKCMGCHKIIATDKPRIKKLTEYWKNKTSPPWKKVHDLPDFVHFTHEKHLKTLLFDREFPVENVKEICALCHGEVENMTVARKVKSLTMGFCVDCHMKNQELGAPGDCWKCHK